MTTGADRPLDEFDVEAAIGEGDPTTEPEAVVAAPLEDLRDEQAELDATEEDATEAMRRHVDTGGPGPEERILHLEDPVTEALDDETDLDEESLDAGQRDEVEWRLSAAADDAGPT